MKARILTAKRDVSFLSKGKLYDVSNLKEYDSEVYFTVINDGNREFRCILKNDQVIQGDWEFVYPKFVEAPCDWKHGKKGQVFKVEKPDMGSFRIIVEKNEELYCLWKSCAFINLGDWIERWDSDYIETLSDEVSSEYPKYVEAPCDNKPISVYSFKKGKLYKTYGCEQVGFYTRDDNDKELSCLWEGCAHLSHENIDWIKRWDLQYVTKDTIFRINNKIDKPLNKIAKRPIVEEQWYKFGGLYTSYAKASKGLVKSSETFYYSESIENKDPLNDILVHTFTGGTIDKDFLIGEATLEEIQKYLPDDHPDKIKTFAVGDYVLYRGTKSKDGQWDNYFGKYGVKTGDVGIISAAYPSIDEYFVKDVIRNSFESGILSAKDLSKTDEYTYKVVSEAMLKRNSISDELLNKIQNSDKPKIGDYIKYNGTKSSDDFWYRYFGVYGVQPGDVGIISHRVGDMYYINDIFRGNNHGALLKQDFKVISEAEYDEGCQKIIQRIEKESSDKLTEKIIKATNTDLLKEMVDFAKQYVDRSDNKLSGLKTKPAKSKGFKPSIIKSIDVKLTVKKS